LVSALGVSPARLDRKGNYNVKIGFREPRRGLETLEVPVETGIFSDVAPDEYAVVTPLYDNFELFCDNLPKYDVQEVRLSLFTKGNYSALKSKIIKALLSAEFTITGRQYISHEDDSNYHHYAIDTAKLYKLED
jgi:hypothetical protein